MGNQVSPDCRMNDLIVIIRNLNGIGLYDDGNKALETF